MLSKTLWTNYYLSFMEWRMEKWLVSCFVPQIWWTNTMFHQNWNQYPSIAGGTVNLQNVSCWVECRHCLSYISCHVSAPLLSYSWDGYFFYFVKLLSHLCIEHQPNNCGRINSSPLHTQNATYYFAWKKRKNGRCI